MLMDSFEVENFRSLKHLKLEKLARVNLLVGKSNSGKTSVLESIFLMPSMNGTSALDIIEKERGLYNNRGDFKYLFYRFDSNRQINLSVTQIDKAGEDVTSIKSLRVCIELEERNTQNKAGFGNSVLRNTVYSDSLTEPLVFNTGRLDGDFFSSPISEQARKISREFTSSLVFKRFDISEILTTQIDRQTLSEKIEAIKLKKQDSSLLQILQLVDNRIKRIELLTGGQIYLDLGDDFSALLPLNLMGEGIQRLLDVLSAFVSTPGGVVLIDEIDNGLHYSALRILWKGILRAAREYDVQVIATTHSAEALRHLTWVLDDEEFKDYRGDIASYTLIRAEDDDVRSYRYDYEQLEFAMEHDIEVRN